MTRTKLESNNKKELNKNFLRELDLKYKSHKIKHGLKSMSKKELDKLLDI